MLQSVESLNTTMLSFMTKLKSNGKSRKEKASQVVEVLVTDNRVNMDKVKAMEEVRLARESLRDDGDDDPVVSLRFAVEHLFEAIKALAE